MIRVVDDFIPLSFQEEIKTVLLKNGGFPWYFLEHISYGNSGEPPAFIHHFKVDNIPKSEYLSLVVPLAHLGAERAEHKYNGIYAAKTILQLPLNESLIKNKTDFLHVDLLLEHLVVLYYVIDSDGDTIIVDKTMQNNSLETGLMVENFNVLAQVTPKQGRAVLFDGRHYHTAQQPSNNKRCIININVI
jgi:hypothetical protein